MITSFCGCIKIVVDPEQTSSFSTELRWPSSSFSVNMIDPPPALAVTRLCLDLMVLMLTPGDKVPHPEGTTAYVKAARRIMAKDKEQGWKEPRNAKSYGGVKTSGQKMPIHGHNVARIQCNDANRAGP